MHPRNIRCATTIKQKDPRAITVSKDCPPAANVNCGPCVWPVRSGTERPSGDNEGVTSSNSDLRSLTSEKRNSAAQVAWNGEGEFPTSGALNSWSLTTWCQMFPRASGEGAAAGELIWISDKPRMRLGWNITGCRCLCKAQDSEALKWVIKTTWCNSARSQRVHLQISNVIVQLKRSSSMNCSSPVSSINGQ